jgi:hypothetical protein
MCWRRQPSRRDRLRERPELAAIRLPAPSEGPDDRRELDVGRRGAECVELGRVQEHDAALAAGKELRLIPATALPHYADAVIALEFADAAAPFAARYGNGRRHDEIVVILLQRCPFSARGKAILDGGGARRANGEFLLMGTRSPVSNCKPYASARLRATVSDSKAASSSARQTAGLSAHRGSRCRWRRSAIRSCSVSFRSPMISATWSAMPASGWRG